MSMTVVMPRPAVADPTAPIGHAGRVPAPATEFDPRRLRRLRQYTWWAVVPVAPVYAGVVGLDIAGGVSDGKYGPVELAVLLVVAVVITVEATRFCLGMMQGLGRGTHPAAEQAAVFLLALGAMAYALTQQPYGVPWVLFPAVLAAATVATTPRWIRWWLEAAAVVATTSVAVAAAALSSTEPGLPLGAIGLYSAGAVVFTTCVLITQAWFWDVILELDRARSIGAELAVARERLRFAAELHDVQGHHLQAIALKGELAERLVGVDDASARAQAAEVAELARTALRDTREVVHGYRHSDLAKELDNAREILEAAGIATTVDGAAGTVAPPLQPLFGALVREGATNILRHSRAVRCEMTIDRDGTRVVVRNDGSRTAGDGTGTGIEGLRERFAVLGGCVDAGTRDGWFELSGRAGRPR